jgi:hypothetical protein
MNDTSDTHAKGVDTTLIVRAPALLTLVLVISANARNAEIKTIILSREIIKLCKKNAHHAAVNI